MSTPTHVLDEYRKMVSTIYPDQLSTPPSTSLDTAHTTTTSRRWPSSTPTDTSSDHVTELQHDIKAMAIQIVRRRQTQAVTPSAQQQPDPESRTRRPQPPSATRTRYPPDLPLDPRTRKETLWRTTHESLDPERTSPAQGQTTLDAHTYDLDLEPVLPGNIAKLATECLNEVIIAMAAATPATRQPPVRKKRPRQRQGRDQERDPDHDQDNEVTVEHSRPAMTWVDVVKALHQVAQDEDGRELARTVEARLRKIYIDEPAETVQDPLQPLQARSKALENARTARKRLEDEWWEQDQAFESESDHPKIKKKNKNRVDGEMD